MLAPYGMDLQEDCSKCTLRKDGFFCHLASTARAALQNSKHTSAYPSGAVLFVEGQASRGVYLICKGRVKLTMASLEGRTVIARIGEAGEVLGMNAAISGQPYELTAEALEPSQINFIRREEFLRMMHEVPDFCFNAAEQLTRYYHRANQQIRYLGLAQSATERLARFLLANAAKGEVTQQGVRFNLRLTHEEIAQIVGVSRETVTRSLTDLRHKMLISTKGASVLIRNRTGLEALAAEA